MLFYTKDKIHFLRTIVDKMHLKPDTNNHYDNHCIQFKPGENDTLNYSYYIATGTKTDYFSETIGGRPVYRYCGVNKYLLSDLIDGTSLLKISGFNDIYDSTITTKDDTGQWFIKCDANSKYYCRSFSESNNSIHMWSLYANENKGVCVEYDPSLYSCCLYRVKYEPKPIDYSPLEDLATGKITNKEMLSILIKSDQWAEEKEWRIITDLPMDAGQYPKIHMPVKRIYFGCKFGSGLKTDDAHYENIKQLYAQLRKLIIEKKIKVSVGKIPADKYSIVFDDYKVQDLIEEDGTPICYVLNSRV